MKKKLFIATWKNGTMKSHGYIKAENAEEAERIARKELQKHCEIESINEAHTEPTPQSLTLNFSNDKEYTLFG